MPRARGAIPATREPVVAQEATRLCAALLRRAHQIPRLDAIILFGSSVDGTFDKSSDIDLLFLVDTAKNPEITHGDIVSRLVARAAQDAKTDRNVTPLLLRTRARMDDTLRKSVAGRGLVVWSRAATWLPRAEKDLGPHVLVTYSTGGLASARRVKVQHLLFGQRGAKRVGPKTYRWDSSGLVEPDRRIAPGTLLLSAHEAPRVVAALQRLGAKVTQRRFYIA